MHYVLPGLQEKNYQKIIDLLIEQNFKMRCFIFKWHKPSYLIPNAYTRKIDLLEKVLKKDTVKFLIANGYDIKFKPGQRPLMRQLQELNDLPIHIPIDPSKNLIEIHPRVATIDKMISDLQITLKSATSNKNPLSAPNTAQIYQFLTMLFGFAAVASSFCIPLCFVFIACAGIAAITCIAYTAIEYSKLRESTVLYTDLTDDKDIKEFLNLELKQTQSCAESPTHSEQSTNQFFAPRRISDDTSASEPSKNGGLFIDPI